MGFSFSWIAVRGLSREQVLEALGAEVADVQADILEGLALFDWPEGWVIVFSDDYRDAIQGQLATLGRLAQSAVARGFDAEKTYNVAAGYESGHDRWSVTVNPSRRVFRVVGHPPEQLNSIVAAAKAEQANTDVDLFFEIPAVLAESICGFRLGGGDPDAIRHVSLKRIKAENRKPVGLGGRKPGFLARLFGQD